MVTSLLLNGYMNQWINMYVCTVWIIWSGQGMYAIMIGGSTYVGMITVHRARQPEMAQSDMVTREVGRDRLVRLKLSRRESYKRRRRRREVNYMVDYRYIITLQHIHNTTKPNPASICIISAFKYTK